MPLLFCTIIHGGGAILAPWITTHFGIIAAIVLLIWFWIISTFYKKNAISLNASSLKKGGFWTVTILFSLILFIYFGLFLRARYLNKPKIVAFAFSPDQKWKAYAVRNTYVDVIYDLLLEPNRPITFFARPLGSVGFDGSEQPTGSVTVLWSKDSQKVSLWADGVPFFSYDLQKDTPIDVRSLSDFQRQP